MHLNLCNTRFEHTLASHSEQSLQPDNGIHGLKEQRGGEEPPDTKQGVAPKVSYRELLSRINKGVTAYLVICHVCVIL